MSLDLDAIEARVNAATPGPWERGDVWGWDGSRQESPEFHDHRISGPNGAHVVGVYGYDYEVGGIPEASDTEFIAHALADVPALVAEVRRLRAAVKELRSTAEGAAGALAEATEGAQVQWAVAHGLSDDPAAGAEDAAGLEVFDDEAAAREDLQWRVAPGLFLRTVAYGPWVRVTSEAS